MNSKQKFRAQLIFVAMLIGAGFLASSLYYTQVIHGPDYSAKANIQYGMPAQSLFDRGSIYFDTRDDVHIAAATVGSGFLVYMNPTLVTNAGQTYDALSHFIKIDRKAFTASAGKANDHYEEVKQQLDATTSAAVGALQLPGIFVVPQNWRVYPGGRSAAHELGIVGEDASSSSITGRYGLERSYENVLTRVSIGSSASIFAQMFGLGSGASKDAGSRASSPQANNDNNGKPGDVITTIDPTVEKYLEKVLAETASTWKPDEIGGIIMDPNTGEIAAMSSLPTFDPNNTSNVKNPRTFSDPLVENVYEMGSIMKPMTMATALDTGAETASSTYDDTGTLTLSGKKISNYDGRARGIIPMQQILSQSLNVGAATIALKVGKVNFDKYFENFGIGLKTGIDLPSEATGIIGNLKTGRDVEVATAAYGQGIAVSPITMARTLSILANGGYVITPHIAKEIDYVDGTTKTILPGKIGPVLKKKTTDEVTDMLVTVVDGTIATKHPNIHFDRYSIAAKTGTAQIADPVHGGYYSDRYLHSFFGYFPAYNPKFIVFLYQVYPKGAEYASETLTDPFTDITKFLIDYYNVTPDR